MPSAPNATTVTTATSAATAAPPTSANAPPAARSDSGSAVRDLIVQHPRLDDGPVAAYRAVIGRAPDRRTATSARWRGATVTLPEVRRLAARHAVDANLLPAGLRLDQFRLLAMDMDSTLITVECIDELADHAGRKAEVAAITEAAMRGEITDYTESLGRRLAALAGLPAAVLNQVYAERIRTSPGARELLAAVQRAGLSTLLVSGGFTWFTDQLARELGIDVTRANRLEIRDGIIVGRLAGSAWGPGPIAGASGVPDPSGLDAATDRQAPGPIVDADIKRQTLLQRCSELDIDAAATLAIGDGSNDLPMLRAAGLAIAWRAKPLVRAEVACALDHSGLDALLDWF